MDRILDLIYDAAGEQELWPAVLTAIADVTQSEGGVLYGQSLAAQRVYFDFNSGLSEECNRVYQQRHTQNLWSLAMQDQLVGHLVLSDEVVSLSDLQKTEFYGDVLRPQDIGHNAMIALAAKDDFRVAFNMCRSLRRGAFEDQDRKTLEVLAPHLRRSMSLGFRLTGYSSLHNAAFDVIEKLTDGVVIMGPQGHVLFANQTACAIEAEGTLKLRPIIASWSPPHSRRLASLVRAALAGDAGGAASVPSIDGTRLLVVLVISLRSREVSNISQAHGIHGACAAFVIDPLRREMVGERQLMDAYGMTKAEARVAVKASSSHLRGGACPGAVPKHGENAFETYLYKDRYGGARGTCSLACGHRRCEGRRKKQVISDPRLRSVQMCQPLVANDRCRAQGVVSRRSARRAI